MQPTCENTVAKLATVPWTDDRGMLLIICTSRDLIPLGDEQMMEPSGKGNGDCTTDSRASTVPEHLEPRVLG